MNYQQPDLDFGTRVGFLYDTDADLYESVTVTPSIVAVVGGLILAGVAFAIVVAAVAIVAGAR